MKKIALLILIFLMGCNTTESDKKILFEVIDISNQNYGQHIYRNSPIFGKKEILGKLKISNFSENTMIYTFNKKYIASWYSLGKTINKYFDESKDYKQVGIKKSENDIFYFRIPERFDTIYLWVDNKEKNKINHNQIKLIKNEKNKIVYHSRVFLSRDTIVQENDIPLLE